MAFGVTPRTTSTVLGRVIWFVPGLLLSVSAASALLALGPDSSRTPLLMIAGSGGILGMVQCWSGAEVRRRSLEGRLPFRSAWTASPFWLWPSTSFVVVEGAGRFLFPTPLVLAGAGMIGAGVAFWTALLLRVSSPGFRRSFALSLGRGLFFGGALFLGALLVGEAVARWSLPPTPYGVRPDEGSPPRLLVSHPILLRQTTANFRGKTLHPNFPGLTVRTNAQGFRDRPWSDRSEAYRILVLGDSFVFGVGVEEDETFLRGLEEGFSLGTLQTVNLGVPGHAPSQSLLLLHRWCERLSPSAVLVTVFLGNDLADELTFQTHLQKVAVQEVRHWGRRWRSLGRPAKSRSPKKAKSGRTRGVTVGSAPRSARPPFAALGLWPLLGKSGYWATSSRLFLFFQPRVVEVAVELGWMKNRTLGTEFLLETFAQTPTPRVSRALQFLRGAILHGKRFCEERGLRFGVLLIPHILQADQDLYERSIAESVREEEGYDPEGFFDRVQADLEGLEIPVLDPRATLRKKMREGVPPYHPEGHWNSEGHRVVAELLRSWILEQGWIPPGSLR